MSARARCSRRPVRTRRGPLAPGEGGRDLCNRSWRRRAGVQARDRRLRLLDLPAQRHRDVLLLLRGACGAADGDRGRSVGARSFQPAARRDRDRLPARIELHLRAVGGGAPGRATSFGPSWCCSSRACSASPFWCWRRRNSRPWSPQGAGPQRSAFLSSFFALVGCHGLHVTAGLLWLGTMMAQVFVKGFRPNILRRHDLLQSVLACARHHLGGDVHDRLSDRRRPMSDSDDDPNADDVAPGFTGAARGQRSGRASRAI